MKKQFRLYDIYRFAASGNISSIRGIESYEVNKDATTLHIVFDNCDTLTRFAKIEDDLKAIVKEVNKILRNCRKPGRKSKC
jgi:hypothetical protein